MDAPEPNPLREKVVQLALESQQQGSVTDWFEQVYHQASGNSQQIPWAKLEPHPHLAAWLKAKPPDSLGKTALVIGCGLGDDAEFCAGWGWHVSAFDISPTAIAWCRQRFPTSSVNYQVADLFAFHPDSCPTFDLVIESRTIQSLPLEVRERAMTAIANLVGPQGTLLVITGLRPETSLPDGPPWPLSETELALFTRLGLQECQRGPFLDKEKPQLRQEYRKTVNNPLINRGLET